MTTGSVKHKGYGRPRATEESVERIRETFHRSPTKSVRQASRELQMTRSTIHDVLHKQLRLTAYKVQILHAIKPNDYAKRYGFAVDMLHRLDADEHFLNRTLFSDESPFHVFGMVNKHNVRFWGSEQSQAVRELQRSSEKWGYVKDTVYGTQVNSLEELKQNIQTAVATVDVSMLKRLWMELEYCLDIVRATKGSHVEIS
ncbi:DUF4817 domain-containing protein [Trichonephila clavipes]|nr:DUF4817 domain-containing protein [Trichonephila clavipes]